MAALIDIDDPSTWPHRVFERTQEYAERLRGTARYTSDLRVPQEFEDELREALSGQKLHAYHCTRLLEYEVNGIRERGLLPLSAELVHNRIDQAHSHGYLTDFESARLHQSHVFALGQAANREGQVCLVLGRQGLGDGVLSFLSAWGGEGIYRAAPGLEEWLGRLGRPAIIDTGVDLSGSRSEVMISSGLGNMFVGTLLETEICYADVFLRAPVPPEDVLAIWGPGDGDYDRHVGLPQS